MILKKCDILSAKNKLEAEEGDCAYENGNVTQVCHNCNKYIKVDDGSWYQMDFDEANRFGTLLEELNK